MLPVERFRFPALEQELALTMFFSLSSKPDGVGRITSSAGPGLVLMHKLMKHGVATPGERSAVTS